MTRKLVILLLVCVTLTVPSVLAQEPPLDAQLRARIDALNLEAITAAPPASPALVTLGEALFYDKILSGNLDTACATCHHPLLHTTDALALGLGTGTTGLGPDRFHMPGRPFIPRNAPDLFNRGTADWTVMFWDGRVRQARYGTIHSPAGDALPEGLDGVLAAQAMFPVTSPAEMRGFPGDVDIFGAQNTLALLDDEALEPDYAAIWEALTARLLAIPAYKAMFAAAYPGVPPAALGFQHAANAIAAYEVAAFTFTDSPWNRYLQGDSAALTDEAKQGALIFYGAGGCYRCHSGPLLTDQRFHNVATPQLGPGKEGEAPLDYGRGHETGSPDDRFTFRTPPLHNVSLTAPYTHNGAYASLEAVVRHMIDPAQSLREYDPAQLTPELGANVWNDHATTAMLLEAIDLLAGSTEPLPDDAVDSLLAFLDALTDPAAQDLSHLLPQRVPSGLPVDTLAPE